MSRRHHHDLVRALTVFVAAGWSTGIAAAQVSQKDLEAAATQFSDKKYAEAAAAYDKLIPALAPDQAQLKPTLAFNRGCAQLAAGDATSAEKTFLEVDATAVDPSLRAAARYNLGQISCNQAEPMVEKDKAGAIEAYRRAERHFRNALSDQPGNADTTRNIEVVQRRIAKLLEEQKKQEQQQQSDQKDQKEQQDKSDQKNQDKNNPDQKQDQDKQSQQQSEQQKRDQQQKNDQQSKDQQQSPSGQEQKDPQQGKDGDKDEKQPKPGDEKDQKPQDDKAGKDQKDQQKQEQQAGEEQRAPQAGKPQDHREFDLTAAQILDKEKKQRERLKQLLQLMRARAAPVEKDW